MTIKKTVSTLLAAFMILGLLVVCGSVTPPAAAAETPKSQAIMGTLTLLNLTEEECLIREGGKYVALQYLEEQGVFQSDTPVADMPELSQIIYYDTLDAMLMALQAGDITSAELPQCTVDYLCARNDKLAAKGSFDWSDVDNFTKQVVLRLGVGFSFLTLEENAALRDTLNEALDEMKADGTLDALVKTHITDAVSGEPEPIAFTKTDGETLRVAITGALPPMDYVAADGTPAGFNTAILAELGRRLNKNIELVQVDSVGRAAALASGQVDLVFWTNGQDGRLDGGRMTVEAHNDYMKQEQTEEQSALMAAIGGGIGYKKGQNKDIPEGTITTQTYYNDLLIAVALK